ncbi:peptide/nickel transport system ATP-binding protein [Paenibacillus endophyticus]|uniref:Peptide/nickel transport system ATP-binding protein n=1 Tax=Paenibacillus endophyticus TaxID=1294268 RepID=A0A7W5C8L1_9BACL|nr:ATP-binding cassette domain-containing protein [Paenibacillus endophyticus]MBB3153118.1 peptide/nickel transport system ATP-binding protein [Paenibacillus endophyticus]
MRLEGKGIGWRYGNGPWLFSDYDIAIQPGESVGLIGPSGSGKTSLGRLLAGYEKPLTGEVSVPGRSPNHTGYDPVQMIFQHPERAVNPRWSMARTLTEGWSPDAPLLDALGIKDDWLRRYPNELSGGELQRCCIARALGPNTKFLIADEMTTMLDAVTQAQIWHTVLEIASKRQIGLLVISHDHLLVNRICSRIIPFG